MAPVRKRSSFRARTAKSSPRWQIGVDGNATTDTSGQSTPPPQKDDHPASARDIWRLTKKDKRAIKHNVLMGKVRDASVTKTRKRRPGKKMKAVEGLDELRGSLPDVDPSYVTEEDTNDDDHDWEGFSGSDVESGGLSVGGTTKRRRRRAAEGNGKMIMKSLKHRPGAMKWKRKMEHGEVERFGKNLAQLAGASGVAGATVGNGVGGSAPDQTSAAQADKWAALRRFIGGTMERNKAFAAG